MFKNSEESFLDIVKKTPNFKGKIDIEIISNNDYIMIKILDNIGIPDIKSNDSYFTTKIKGTGLGLPIVNKIISEHSGDFSIQNKKDINNDKGTKVEISLQRLMHKEILVIDDNPDIRFLICNILKEKNFNVRSAANYDQAILEINKKMPDLAIIDIKLDKTDKDGIDLLKLIMKKNKFTPVIMISGHATVQIAVEAIRLGAYEFIENLFRQRKY